MNINALYEKEKTINSYFRKKYNYESEEIFNKQILELLCELSEFAYETKCFKYWKSEKQSNPEITISEFADCLMITLSFCDLANIKEIKLDYIKEKDIVKLFIEANTLAVSLFKGLNEKCLLRLLSILVTIAKSLSYSKNELNKYCIEKFDKTLSMISNQ